MQTTNTQKPNSDERPLEPHKPRRDAKRFSLADTERYSYDHQHTYGWGPVQSCTVVEQYDDGYCKAIYGYTTGLKPATATVWSGCLTRSRELDAPQIELLEMYRKEEKQALRKEVQ